MDLKVEMRRRWVSIAGTADISDRIPAVHRCAFGDPIAVAIQVRVVIAVLPGRVKLIDGVPAGLAQEQLYDSSIVYSENLGAARRHDVCRLMLSCSAPRVVKHDVDV